jgi:chromosome segregation ATPase
LISDLAGTDVWDAWAKSTLTSALERMINDRYRPLKRLFSRHQTVATWMGEHNELFAANRNLRERINGYEGNISGLESQIRELDSEDDASRLRELGSQITANRNNINASNEEIAQNEARMRVLEGLIDGSIQ